METYRSLGPGDDNDSDAGTHICGRHKGDDDDSDAGVNEPSVAAATEWYCQFDEPCFIQQARLFIPPLE